MKCVNVKTCGMLKAVWSSGALNYNLLHNKHARILHTDALEV